MGRGPRCQWCGRRVSVDTELSTWLVDTGTGPVQRRRASLCPRCVGLLDQLQPIATVPEPLVVRPLPRKRASPRGR